MILRVIILSVIAMALGMTVSNGQEAERVGCPDGIYKSKEDFVNKIPSEVCELIVKEIELIHETDSLIHRCFFLNKETNKKIKKVFAISHNGNLYFSNWAILKNKTKKDKSVSAASMNSFVLVTIFGPKYLYAEAGLVNHWQYGLSGGVAGGLGGLVGSAVGEAVNNSFPETTEFGTGVVWDVEAKEFNIFRNCPDFNEFLNIHNIENIDCGNELFDLKRIRDVIESVNN